MTKIISPALCSVSKVLHNSLDVNAFQSTLVNVAYIGPRPSGIFLLNMLDYFLVIGFIWDDVLDFIP